MSISFTAPLNRGFEVGEATLNDCEGILDVLNHNRSVFLDKENATKSKTGFLVYPFTQKELAGWIKNNQTFKVLVARNSLGIIGYILGFFKNVEKLSEYKGIKSYSDIIKHGNKVFYLRHIAIKKDKESGVGQALLDHLVIALKRESYTHILDEICEFPVVNQRSISFHLRNRFSRIGEVTGTDSITWGVFLRNLDGNLKSKL